MERTWRIYALAMGCAIGVYFLLPVATQSILYDAIGLTAGTAMLVGARRRQAAHRAAYLLLAFGVLDLAAGDILFGTAETVPSIADMLYISAYPLLALGIYGIVTQRAAVKRQPGPLLGAAVAAAAAALAWAFLILPTRPAAGALPTRAVALGYPLMDLVLIFVLLRPVGGRRLDTPVARCICAALVALLVADVSYVAMNFGTRYSLGGLVDVGWLLAYALFGAALLHPSLQDEPVAPLPRGVRAPAPSVLGRVAVEPIHQPQLVRPLGNSVRIDLLAVWTGKALVPLAGFTLLMSLLWLVPSLILVAGAYGLTGTAMIVAGSPHSHP